MDTGIGSRKSVSWLAAVAILGLCIAQLASPQSVLAHPSQVQGVAHPQNVGPPVGNPLPPNQRFSPGRQAFFGDAACNAQANAFFSGDPSDPLFGNQMSVYPGNAPSVQSWLAGPGAAFWYGYATNQVAGWSYATANYTSPVGLCGGFQALTP
jgi:hypothetical protein